MADELAAVGNAGIALDSDAATRASLWIGCALATWSHSLRAVATGQVPVAPTNAAKNTDHRFPNPFRPSSRRVFSVLPSACDLSQSQPTARRILAA